MNNPKGTTKEERVRQILASDQFKHLVSNRWRVSILLTIVMLTVYFGFILTIAFKKELLATKIGEHLTIGIPIGIGIILLAWTLTGVYVQWANNHYDKQVEEIKKEL
jgi:uncharacterized membrane protein (DUF485 family)